MGFLAFLGQVSMLQYLIFFTLHVEDLTEPPRSSPELLKSNMIKLDRTFHFHFSYSFCSPDTKSACQLEGNV